MNMHVNFITSFVQLPIPKFSLIVVTVPEVLATHGPCHTSPHKVVQSSDVM